MKKSTQGVRKLRVIFGAIVPVLTIAVLCGTCTKVQAKSEKALQKLIQTAPDFMARIFHDQEGRILRYRILEPFEPLANCKYPLVVVLSGSGERGQDNISQLKYAGPFFNRLDNRKNHPCYVVIPQCPGKQNWVARENNFGTVSQPPEATEPLQLTLLLISSLQLHLNIDPKRIYLMGISSGASGVWDLVARYPNTFAAAVPFAGCGDPTQAGQLIHTPFWIFHGALDLLVNRNCSRLMYQALVKAGGKPRYTEYPMTSHSCWLKAFHDPELLNWLFTQHRP